MKRRNFLRITLPLTVAGHLRAEPAETPELLFGVIADPQYADQNARGSRFYRNSPGKLKTAIEDLNKEPLKFVVTLGDIIDNKLKSFGDIMPLYENLRAPRRFILGNHDFAVDDVDKDKILPALNMEKPYSREDHGKWAFLYLDGTDISTWRQPKDDPRTAEASALLKKLAAEKLPQAQSWNAAIGAEQMAWIKKELETAKAAGQRVIVFNHFPVIPANAGHNLWNDRELVALFEQYDHIAAYMNGHNHAGNYGTHHGCHYVNFKGMVETSDKTAYGIVRCYPDRLEIDGFGNEPDRNLA
ncbi:MAG: metallophosphoesterase [Verrucomicrobia bacterium]|nr:metallophosphoesterase [Verrucomicrobiota bacterium]MDA1005246.1 metallophosphoesterase [Verrucomicrobiota bacterium]